MDQQSSMACRMSFDNSPDNISSSSALSPPSILSTLSISAFVPTEDEQQVDWDLGCLGLVCSEARLVGVRGHSTALHWAALLIDLGVSSVETRRSREMIALLKAVYLLLLPVLPSRLLFVVEEWYLGICSCRTGLATYEEIRCSLLSLFVIKDPCSVWMKQQRLP